MSYRREENDERQGGGIRSIMCEYSGGARARRGQTSLLLLSWPGQLGMLCLWHLVVGPPTGGHKEVVRRGHGGGEGEVVRRGGEE